MWWLLIPVIGGGYYFYDRRKKKSWMECPDKHRDRVISMLSFAESSLEMRFNREKHRLKCSFREGNDGGHMFWGVINGKKVGAYCAWDGRTARVVYFTNQNGYETDREIAHELAHAVLFSCGYAGDHHKLMRVEGLY